MTASLAAPAADLRGQPRSRYQIDCAGAQLHIHARSLATVLRIDGEIDALNADVVAHDLSHLDFIGSAGLSALQILNDEHRRAGLHCSVVGGAALRRLTQVRPDHGLPVVHSVPQALRHTERVIRSRRRSVSGPARQEEPQRA